MRNSINTKKQQEKPAKSSGRFASPEAAAIAKNANLNQHIKALGLKVAGPEKTTK